MWNCMLETNKIYQGDVLEVLKTFPDESIDCIVTSPPYWNLRDYQILGQIGLEQTLKLYIEKMLTITEELLRVLKSTGTFFLNHGDCYGGSGKGGGNKNDWGDRDFYGRVKTNAKEKSLSGQNYRLVIRMCDEQGWYWRNTIIWYKRNAMPSSVRDRFGVDYEPIFFFTKNKRYYFEQQFELYTNEMNRWGGDYFNLRVRDSEKEKSSQYKAGEKEKAQYGTLLRDKREMRPHKQGRNKRCVWDIPTRGYPGAHFAVFPKALVETPIKAGSPENGIVLDPFCGSGTTLEVARQLGRQYIGIELSKEYIKLAENRLAQSKLL